ncbi:MAG: hypothetical protein WC180_06195 [Candidatus Paceibacterota bacterium]|jgi:hypothetical protein
MIKSEIFKDNKVYTGGFKNFLTGKVPFDVKDRFCKSVSQKYSTSNPSITDFNKWMHTMCYDGDRISSSGDFKTVQMAIDKAK